MNDAQKEVFVLMVVPICLAAFVTVGGIRQVSDAKTTYAVIAAIVAGVVGLALIPIVELLSRLRGHSRGGRSPRWLAPLLSIVVGGVALLSSVGHAAQGALLLLWAGVLASFAVLSAIKTRKRSLDTRGF